MQPKQITVGQSFGRWTVKDHVHGSPKKTWLCRCSCGSTKTVRHTHLLSGASKSCGCLNVEIAKARVLHGHARKGQLTREMRSWLSMRSRCTHPTNNRWPRYGGRGIKVCRRWETFQNFLKDMGPMPNEKCSIDRIDNDGDYKPSNCRWADRLEQGSNRSDSRRFALNGNSMTIPEMSREYGVSVDALRRRLVRLKWKPEDAFSKSDHRYLKLRLTTDQLNQTTL